MAETSEDLLFGAGDVIFDTQHPLETAYFILEGSVDLTVSLGGRDIELRFGANHFVGDAAVAVGPKPNGESPAYRGRAVAHQAVRAVAIPIEDIKAELDACPPLLRAWFASFISRVLTIVETLSND